MEYFTLSAVPNSQMWHQSADQVVSTAPIVYRRLERQLISAKVTVIGEWLTECNQGGSILFVSHQSEHGSSSLAVTSCEWIKAGFEICDGDLHAVSEHANSRGTDWEVLFLHTPHLWCIWLSSCNGRMTRSGYGTS